MTTKSILPNRYWYLYKWTVGGENIKQKYEHLKTTFNPAFKLFAKFYVYQKVYSIFL